MKQSMTRLERVPGGPKEGSLWKTLIALTMGSVLCAGAAAEIDGAANTKAVAEAAQSRSFDVRERLARPMALPQRLSGR